MRNQRMPASRTSRRWPSCSRSPAWRSSPRTARRAPAAACSATRARRIRSRRCPSRRTARTSSSRSPRIRPAARRRCRRTSRSSTRATRRSSRGSSPSTRRRRCRPGPTGCSRSWRASPRRASRRSPVLERELHPAADQPSAPAAHSATRNGGHDGLRRQRRSRRRGGGVQVSFQGAVGPFDAAVDQVRRFDDAEEVADRQRLHRQRSGGRGLIDVYVRENKYFVALKLLNGVGVKSIQPIVLTFRGTEACVPLRLTAIAANPDMPVLVWVLSDKRVAPARLLRDQDRRGAHRLAAQRHQLLRPNGARRARPPTRRAATRS